MPEDWQSILMAFNMSLPNTISLLCGIFALTRLRVKAATLEEGLLKAEAIAQKIVDFDVSDIADKPSEDRVVNLMVQVAQQMKLYRPYLPPELFAADDPGSDGSDDESLDTNVLPCDDASTVQSATTSPAHILTPRFRRGSAVSELSRAASALATALPAPSPDPLPPGAVLHFHSPRSGVLSPRSVECRTGTLLAIRVADLEPLSAVRSPESLARVQEVSDVFAQLVVAIAREHKGIVRSLAHDRGLISWNLSATCHQHVGAALGTALAIRDQFRAKFAAPALSMGLWTGPLLVGTIGTADFKAFAFTGQGVARVTPFC